MNRIERLMGITTVLQSKKFVSAEHLSEKFGISVRTVYRDVKALGEIGIPVGFEPHKGYFIMEGYFLSPVSFTSEEANALVLMETLADRFGDRSIKQHYETALSKIKSVLRGTQKDKLEHLYTQIRIYKHPSTPDNPAYLSEIQKAITDKTILKIGYRNNMQEESVREVEPIGLTYYSGYWHMIAWCWKRRGYRDFKTSHILQLQYTQLPFRKEEHIDINAYIRNLE